MDIEDAWERFIRSEGGAFAKGSLDGKMDTIAAQIQEMSTDLTRLTNLIPDLAGKGQEGGGGAGDIDEDSVLSMLEPLAGGGGAPEGGAPEESGEEASEEGAEEGGEAPPEEEMPGGDEDEDAVEKAADPTSASSEGLMPPVPPEEDDGPIDGPVFDDEIGEEPMPETPMPEEAPDDGMEPPGLGDHVEPIDDVVPDEPEVERIEPAGQEGIPPEGVPDLLDEINATQPDGLLNIYDRFIDGMRRAASEAADKGDLASVSNIAGAQNAIDAIWKDQVAPVMDGIEGGDRFRRSCAEPERFVKSGRNPMSNGELMDGTVASSHQVEPSRTSSEGEESTTGASNAATAPVASDGTVEGSGAPHALNNDNHTTEANPASFEKSDVGAGEVADVSVDAGTDPIAKCGTCSEHTEKSMGASPPDNGEGMTPAGEGDHPIDDEEIDAYMKSLEDFEGYEQDYVDPTPEDPYTDPIRKSVPSFREVMAEGAEDRFLLAAAMRRGPHLSMDEFRKSWDERRAAKSASAGQPIEGMDPVQGSDDDFEKCGDAAPQDFEKSDKGTASIGNTPVADALQGPTCDAGASTGLDDVDSKMRKSMENGKPIASMRELMSFKKSYAPAADRPDCVAGVNGDLRRPDEDPSTFIKSDAPKVRMGYGVDPSEVVARDWEEYRVYKARRGFNRY